MFLKLITDGFFRLDGGALFGVIPKAIWEKKCPADEKNRVRVCTAPLFIDTGRHKVLVDTGMGVKYDHRFREIYAIEGGGLLLSELKRQGLSPSDITIVIVTHLHFDHAGGNTVVDADGHIGPTFPRATYFVQRGEWEDAIHPNERSRASYRVEDFGPVYDAGQFEFLTGDSEILPGIEAVVLPGHIRCLQGVKVMRPEGTIFWPGDLMATSLFVPPTWISAFDLYPLETLETKKQVLRRAAQENWLLAFYHDPVSPCGRVALLDSRPVFTPEEL